MKSKSSERKKRMAKMMTMLPASKKDANSMPDSLKRTKAVAK